MKRQPTKNRQLHEWVGGRLTAPFYITEAEPFRPEIVLWLELPDEFVVGSTLIDPHGPPVSFTQTLLEAMESPMAGPPRRPTLIRIGDPQLAAEVRDAFTDIEVVEAPTPELNRLLKAMAESLPGMPGNEDTSASYFEGGRVSEETIDYLFRAAGLLFTQAPWKVASDTQVLRLDIPVLGVEGACVSIIGALGESLGFIVFPSFLAFEAFLRAAEIANATEEPIDLGTTTLSLNFERGAELPASMRREVAEHGWPVADPHAYPWVQHRDRDGMPRPLSEGDVRIVAASAQSLATFFLKHRKLFEGDTLQPVCESFFDENDLEVRFTVPYEAEHSFAANERNRVKALQPSLPPEQRKVGRNDPCPCGSGKKYKKCCLGKEKTGSTAERAPATVHELDQRLVEEMMRFAERRFGDAWRRGEADFLDPENAVELFASLAVYYFTVEGKPVVDWFIEAQQRRLSHTELAWLKAQQVSWFSAWEVTSVDPGYSLSLHDLLTDEERTVREASGSTMLVKRDVVLGRIVDHDGLSVICGLHPRPLPPLPAAEVIERIRKRLRHKRAVPIDRLRDEKIGRYMIACWEEALDELDLKQSILPQLQNTDGDELLLTVDHLEIDLSNREEIERRLSALEGVEPPAPDDPNQSYAFTIPGNAQHRDAEMTVVGRATLSDGKLRLSTNSIQRADALRTRIEAACGELVKYRAREHSDPVAGLQQQRKRDGLSAQPSEIPPSEASEAIREFKAKYYISWIDQPVPVLKGKTPREATRTKTGREQVDLLLRDCENREARLPEKERFDFAEIRRKLGLDG